MQARAQARPREIWLDIGRSNATLPQPKETAVNDLIETFEEGGYTVRIERDPDPLDPSDCFMGKIAFLDSSRHTLGNERVTAERMDELRHMPEDECVRIPVYAHVHSGTTLKASDSGNPFSCPWDSRQCGFTYADAETVKQFFGVIAITPEIRRQAEEVLRQDVEAYSNWLSGQYCGYVIEDEDENHVDSRWGYDDLDYCREEAKSVLAHTLGAVAASA
jgi:hypothetical protein